MALRYFIKSGIKFGIVGGAVYQSINQGFWRDSESITAYKRWFSGCESIIKPYENLLHYTGKSRQEYWNCGVFATFRGILALPEATKHYSKLAWDKASQSLN